MRTNQKSKAKMFTPDELNAHTTLLTHGGSVLYGLNHADSDEDFYRVVPDEHYWSAIGKHPSGDPKTKAHQTIVDGIDQMIVSEKTFHRFCYEGIPQALEAMFTQKPVIDRLGAFRNDYFAGMNTEHMCGKYMRTIKSFAYGNFKKRRHALRLSLNLRQAMETRGFFNPTLGVDEAAWISSIAASNPELFIETLNSINYFTVEENWNMEEINSNFDKE